VGARSFRYEDEFESCLVYPFYFGIEGTDLPLDCVGNDDTHTGSLGKFSTKYQFTPEQNIYFTIAEGYRRGGANPVPATFDYGRIYSPDTSINYELGTHSAFMNQRLQLSAAVFYIDWKDIQVTGAVEQRYAATFNAKGAHSQGVELEARAEITDYLAMRMGFSYTDAELTEDVTNYNGSGENIFKGDRLPGAPREQWSLGMDYTRASGNALWDANVTLAYADETYTALNDELADYERLKGSTTANARIGLSISTWRLGVFVNNIANARTVTGKRSTGWYGERGQFEYITRPRTIGVSLNYRY
jgi:outer membrane receptor protein involved in Fe transport